MTASPFVTACPACGTRFRVNAAHLNAAGGHVRCGACLEVFVATDVLPAEEAQSAAAAQTLPEVIAEAASPESASPEELDTASESPRQHRFMVLEPLREASAAPSDPTTRRRAVLEGELEPGLSSAQREQFTRLSSDPVEPPSVPQPKRWRAIALLAGVTLLLLAQLLYFQVDRWSSVASFRPVYTGLCYVLGCTVPLYRDDKAMRSANVVVRPHPERSDVLLVDVQVINKAPYPQAFPQLQLDLLDRSGQIITSRVFEADDYRTGELATMPDVPPNRPLQISVEVYRPRENVSSYHFQLLPPGGRT